MEKEKGAGGGGEKEKERGKKQKKQRKRRGAADELSVDSVEKSRLETPERVRQTSGEWRGGARPASVRG